ncbi:MAG: sulfur carrier protein ThiS [Alphaproteobacteria bacterium]|nr:sulfur carrier protein ThiS [Alphaproteobacteria bacterium]
MQILLNGKPLELEVAINVKDLLEQNGYEGKIVAVACNGEFIPKEAYTDTIIQSDDKIEVVAPMQGG